MSPSFRKFTAKNVVENLISVFMHTVHEQNEYFNTLLLILALLS